MSVCTACGESVAPASEPVRVGYAYATDADGKAIGGSDSTGLFHASCWDAWPGRRELGEPIKSDPSHLIEDIDGGRPLDDPE
jgi:hypothetical protein